MCVGTDCNEKEKCYRFTATPNEYRQAYFLYVPKGADGKCEEFWSNEGRSVSPPPSWRKE